MGLFNLNFEKWREDSRILTVRSILKDHGHPVSNFFYPAQQKPLFPTMHAGTTPVEKLAHSIKYSVNSARQTLRHWIPGLKR